MSALGVRRDNAAFSSGEKWFPDRRGMATGMAIMGLGGGAMTLP